MSSQPQIRLLYLVAEAWPTHRADVKVLFGKYLPRMGIQSDLLTESESKGADISWHGGNSYVFHLSNNKALRYLGKFWHSVLVLLRTTKQDYNAVQVRDMPFLASCVMIISKIKGIPFFYWMSFPQSEGQIFRAKSRGMKAGLKYWFPLISGYIGKFVLYRIVLPHAEHVFVQSEKMRDDLLAYDIAYSKMTPVPMGVDIETLLENEIIASDDARLKGKDVAIYLGTLDRARNIEVLFEMLAIAKRSNPNLILVLVGDTEDSQHRAWLESEAERNGVADSVIWTGWIDIAEAWKYVKAAQVGLSPFPRSFLLDSASPTKAVEYMALGLPVVVNDNPDQAKIVEESGAGICVPLNAEAFADALLMLILKPELRTDMSKKGHDYIVKSRSYLGIAESLAKVYENRLK